jgi:transposase
MPKYRIRTTRTSSGSTAVQVVWYEEGKTRIAQHIGSARNGEDLEVLWAEAEAYVAEHNPQRSLFEEVPVPVVAFDRIEATGVSHRFARTVLLRLADQCGLGHLDRLYLDLAIMRIIEPCSKRRSIELLKQYFGVSYTRYLYECLPKLLDQREAIEAAAVATAKSLKEGFALLLYDVTTLYFETHKPDDDLQARGFSKDDKSKQPQIVIGLLVTAQGFPLIQEVFKGNTFEGHTMLSVVQSFQKRYQTGRPIIVADAAMLSEDNREGLDKEGYQYIVGARLGNAKPAFIKAVCEVLPRVDGANLRMAYPGANYSLICSYSQARYRKDKRELEKQIERAQELVARQEPGRRAKFVKKSLDAKKPYFFDDALKQKTEQLLGIKGYCTNIDKDMLSNEEIIAYYHDLWHVEQAFRMSKTDLKARPIFHHSHDAIRAHVLICFMALMIGKYIEIKTERSLRAVRDMLWQVHEVNLHDPTTGRERVACTPIQNELKEILNLLKLENTY